MTDKLVLAYPTLHFISTGRSKLHAIDTETRIHTLCGQRIPRGTEPQPTRKLDEAQLCKRCIASLTPYLKIGKVTREQQGEL